MTNKNLKHLFISAMIAVMVLLATCHFTESQNDEQHVPKSVKENPFMIQWRKEKEQEINKEQLKFARLQNTNAGLQKKVKQINTVRLHFRFKSDSLKKAVDSALLQADSISHIRENIKPLFLSFVKAELQNDSLCNVNISFLEQQVANRDSAIVIQERINENLRELKKEQEERIRQLTEELNQIYKMQRRKIRRNKIVSGGVLLLSGMATLLLIHNRK